MISQHESPRNLSVGTFRICRTKASRIVLDLTLHQEMQSAASEETLKSIGPGSKATGTGIGFDTKARDEDDEDEIQAAVLVG